MATIEPLTVFIGTYTRRESFVDGKAEGIYVYHLDRASGELTHAATVTGAGAVNPSFLGLAPDKRHLYAVNEIANGGGTHGTVSAFVVDSSTGNLRFLNQESTGGLAPCYVSVEPSGRYCLVANYGSGSVCVLPIGEDGRLGEACDVVSFAGRGPDPTRQMSPHAHMIVPGPAARGGERAQQPDILAVDLGTDRLMGFQLDLDRGTLAAADPAWIQLPPGSGPRHLALHPRLPFAYVVGELQSTVTVLDYGQGWGKWRPLQAISSLPADFTRRNLAAAIKIAPSGRHLYVSNRGHDSLAIYAIDQESGRLSLVGHEPTRGTSPRDFAIDPSGALLVVANQESDTVVTFWIDQDNGTLTPSGRVAAVPTPVCLLFGSS